MISITKNFSRVLMIVSVLFALAPSAWAAEGPQKALFVYGGWGGHAPDRYRDILVPWLESEGYEVTVSDTLDIYTDEALMSELDLLVQIWTMGTITGPQLNGLLKAVENGMGIAGWHGGLGDAFRNSPRYQYMIGGQWVSHPGNDGTEYRVNITDHADPVVAGLQDFDIVSEQYYMHVDPNNKVLAATTFNGENDSWIDGASIPVVWKRSFGSGRVFYTSLGHQPEVYEVPEALTILQRGILWAGQSKYQTTPDLVTPVYPAK